MSSPYFAPADLYTFYDETPLLSANINGGGGDCIALTAVSDYPDNPVRVFDTTFGLPVSIPARIYTEGKTPGLLAGPPEQEVLLDIEWSHAVAPGAPIRVYIGDGSNSFSLQTAIDAAVADNACGTINISYTVCSGPATFFTVTLDSAFLQAASQGQSVFVGSGDHGADACDESVPNVSEMSADPNVTSVGGTEFRPDYSNGKDAGFVAESAWNNSSLDTAGMSTTTGGGASAYFAKPLWQIGQGVPDDGRRDVPDIALGAGGLGDPGFLAVFPNSSGNPFYIQGGTSISTPMWAGLSKLIAQAIGINRLGNMNPSIYQLASAGLTANGFRDVLTGNNTYINANKVTVLGYSAGRGYDLTTGWGTVDMATFVAAYGERWYAKDWPMFGHDPRHTGRSLSDTSGNPGLEKWKKLGYYSSVPAIGAGGTIYVGDNTSYSRLVALNLDGTVKWKSTIQDGVNIESSAIGPGGTIYIVANDGKLYAFADNGTSGTLKAGWPFAIGAMVTSSLTIGPGGTIYFGSLNDDLYAVNPDGTLKWAFRTGGYVNSSPAIGADGTIYVGSGDGNLYAVCNTLDTDLNTCPGGPGTPKWAFPTGGPVESSPAIGRDGTIYVGSDDGGLYAITDKGASYVEKWRFPAGGTHALPESSSPAIGADKTIYVGSDDYNLYAITDKGTSYVEKWRFAANNYEVGDPAVGGDGTVYVSSNDGNLYAITDKGTSGKLKVGGSWPFAAGSTEFSSLAIGPHGTIYFATGDGSFHAVGVGPP